MNSEDRHQKVQDGSLESAATLTAAEAEEMALALASPAPEALFRVFDRIATQRLASIVFSASTCDVDAMEVVRVYSSNPGIYPVGTHTRKRETSWGRQVLVERRIFVGEGQLEMAAAFDDKDAMERAGICSIINVPVVLRKRCLGVLNFGRGVDRVSPAEVTLARFLGIAATVVFAGSASPLVELGG